MNRRLTTTLFTTVSAILLAGCCTTRREAAYAPAPFPVAPPPCNNCAPAAVPAPVQFAPPPAAVPALAPTPAYPPAAQPAAPIPQGPVVQGNYFSPPLANPTLQPPEPTVRLAPPELSKPGTTQSVEPPIASVPPVVTEQRKLPATSLPVDIPQFAMARAKVANGQQPFLDGALWLKQQGYRTVLHVHAPGTDDSAARRQFESNGLHYVSLEVDPRSLTKERVERFNKIVTDDANLPLFVYDKDTSITGGLWYLYYRIAENWSDEKARDEVAKLGFRQEQDDNHRTMWIAVQKFLDANKIHQQ